MRQVFRSGMLVAALGGIFHRCFAKAQDRVRIGVLNDQSGVFATYQGIGSVIAAQMAVEDYGGKAAGKPVEVVSADHQNKPDIGVGIARRWYENESVDVIFDLPNSAIALAVAAISRAEEQSIHRIGRRHGASDRRKMHAEYRALDLRHLRLRARSRQGGGRAGRQEMVLHHRRLCVRPRSGKAGQRSRQGLRRRGARRRAPSARHRRLRFVPAAGAGLRRRIVGLANAGDDTVTTIKQAAEFGLAQNKRSWG